MEREKGEAVSSTKKGKSGNSVIGIIILLSLLAFIVLAIRGCTSSGTRDSNGRDKSWATVVAQDIVSDRLKSPSTAKFSWPNETTVTLSGDTWTVRGWVDAQNSFGATIRSNYIVKFTSSATTEWAYTVVSCQIT